MIKWDRLNNLFRVLLITNDPNVSSFPDMFGYRKLDITLVSTLDEIKKQLVKYPPYDLIIIDLDLISDVSFLVWSAPIILLGSHVSTEQQQQLFELDADDYIAKPLDFFSLSLKVRTLLKRSLLKKQLQKINATLQSYLHANRAEAEMASHIFYNNLLDKSSEDLRGFDRYLLSKSDFCGDLTLARYSPSGSIFVLHVDAMGFGLSATVTLLPVVDVFHGMVDKGYALPMIVREMNRKLNYKLPADRFVAASLVEVDLLHEQISIWNGGMPPIYLLSAEGEMVNSFHSSHMALGILEDKRFDASVERIALPKEGGIFACSDGLIEQINLQGESYGNQRLLSDLAIGSQSFMTSHIVASLKDFAGLPGFDDDVSMYFLHFKELTFFLDQQQLSAKSLRGLQDIHPFRWELTLKGQQIAEQEVASQCNNLLQQMGMSQPFCQRVFTVISELSTNAIDHGILGLSSNLKNFNDGFAEYYTQRDKLILNLSNENALRVTLDWNHENNKPSLLIEIQQTGKGFDADKVLAKSPEDLSGRGLLLVKRLASSLVFSDYGRLVQVTLE
ncbi:MAG TPA: SpoIIE family protein phosphatase [Marinospirillum sp.]|uniref:SpoIIE family protein phosphatase n=1 Tax=Marinospirillum sp. TaxID=2183934 RepID=UPI002B4946E7|nr:SpoIIE family protein phosphatase [Marinospirillum sp.]HKM14438.1 SpoIIE family protein phosphatase [Marinospirillum sp.]